MLKPQCNIQVQGENNSFIFEFCESLSVSTSYDTFIDTAEVVLPNRFRFNNLNITDEIQRGDKVTIDVGYETLRNVFQGYVTDIRPDQNLTLVCEDEGYKAKQLSLENKLYKQVALNELIDDNYNGEYEISGTIPNLGDFKIENNPTFLNLLVTLRQVYGITSYWRDRILYIQPALNFSDKTTVFRTNYNIIDYANLNYQNPDNYSIVSKCISINKDDTKTVWYAYYENEEIKTSQEPIAGSLSIMKIVNTPSADVKKYAIDRLQKRIYSGYVGSFIAFGKPFVRHSERVGIVNTKLPERLGVYAIENVQYRFNSDGLRQEIGIKYKLG